MIEPELAFADLNDDMACATAYLQYVVGAFYQFSIDAQIYCQPFYSVVLSMVLVYIIRVI
jgi:aspartyl/asparaginyl-tRNA synthetase